MARSHAAPVTRRTFSRLENPLEVPHLIDIQRLSFEHLTDPKEGLLRETIDDISPIEDYTGNLAIVFGDFKFEEPTHSVAECREKDITYSRPLNVTVAFQNRETGEIREQTVFMGDFPWMTERGTFIINGTERVVVTQLVRSPGAYVMEPKDREKQVFIANLMPARGSWLELEIDKKGRVYARIDRKRKLPVTVLLRAMGFVTDEEILELFDNSVYIRHTIEADTEPTKTEEGALVELFKKQRPGEPPSVDAARALMEQLFFDPKRYDLTRVGRYKLNARLDLDVDLDTRVLTKDDIVALIRELVTIPKLLGIPEEIDEENPIKDYAAEAQTYPRDPINDHLDEYEHFGNRRLRTVGELIQDAFRVGLYRMERVVRERLTTEDSDAITPQTIINIRPVVAAQKEFFGSSQLSQFMDQTNSLAGLTHRRRLSALGRRRPDSRARPDRGPRRPPDPLRPHVPDRDPRGPEHRPDRLAVLLRPGLRARLRDDAIPRGQGRRGHRQDRQPRRDAGGGADDRAGERRDRPEDQAAQGPAGDLPLGRRRAGLGVAEAGGPDGRLADPDLVGGDGADPLPGARRRQPRAHGLQHAAPGRAAAEARGAPRRHRAWSGGPRSTPATSSSPRTTARSSYVDAEQVVVTHGSKKDEYELLKHMRSNQGTIIHQRPIVSVGDKVKAGDVLADGSSTAGGEIALGKNVVVAFMSWEGYNFEDAIIISQRLVKDDELTSIHIEEYEIDARTTKLGDEEITRDIPNRSEESLRNLDERGIVRIGAEVASGDLLVGKVTPKGETELTAEEKLIRAIFKEKAREVRDTSLKVPHGEGGVVIDVITFDRDAGDDLPPGVNNLVRVYVATKRKIAEGDKLAGRHGNKGVISRIVPRGGHAVHGGRHARRRDPEPARRAEPDEHRPDPRDPHRLGRRQRLVRRRHPGLQGGAAKRRPRLRRLAGLRRGDRGGRRRGARALAGRARRRAASTSAIDKSSREGTRAFGTARLFNGRTGEPYESRVTVGNMYILKLLHLVDDKIHARSTGPYSLVTQQPLGGKAQFGGQRFGEMEVWALEAYGAAYTLQEMLTVKSDDTVGRVKAYESIVKSENIPEPSVPESFKVLLKEIQSLGLDVNLVAEEGAVELGEEDDELLRAAEELGIDLSGVRAEGAGRRRRRSRRRARGAGGRRGRGREHERRRRRGGDEGRGVSRRLVGRAA